MHKLPSDFYTNPNVVNLSKQLIGKVLCTSIDSTICKAVITETEGYAGVNDKASHAYGSRRTSRTEIMYAKGGVSYVYLCYGIHFLFNVVSNLEDIPHAILIRAIHPLSGTKKMLKRRGATKFTRQTFVGPGKVSQAMGIHKNHNGIDLQGDTIWIEDHSIEIEEQDIEITTRIGIDYAAEDAKLPYRFILKKSLKKFVD